MKNIAFYSIVIALVITIISPFDVISSNPDDFQIINSASFLMQMFSLFGLFSLLLLIAFSILYKLSKYSDYLLVFIVSVCIIWNLYLPLLIGKLDGVDALSISVTNVFIGIAIGIVIAYFKKHQFVIFPIILIGPLMLSINTMIEQIEFNKTNQSVNITKAEPSIAPLSNDKNILLISFDALQYKYISEVLESDQQIKEAFNGFINFANVNAVAPFTGLSTITTKLGYLPETKSSKDLSLYNADFITSKLAKADYYVETYFYFNYGELPGTHKIPQYGIKPKVSYQTYLKAVEISLLKVFPSTEKVNYLSNRIAKIISDGDEPQIYALIKKDPHPLAYYSQDIVEYDYFIDSLSAANVKPTFKMHHYVFTHEPITFDKSCNYKISNTIPQKASIAGETFCAINKMLNLINKLKELGVYDNTVIILASDHGHEKGYNDASESGYYSVSKRWALSRYQPFLMIKDFNSQSNYQINKKVVSLLDIPKTICLKTLNNNECDVYSGINLFEEEPKDYLTKRQILVSKTDKDKRTYSDFNVVSIARNKSLAEHFKLENANIILEPLNINQQVSFGKKESNKLYTSSGLSHQEGWGRWSNSKNVKIQFKLDKSSCQAKKMSMQLSAFLSKLHAKQTAIISLNEQPIKSIEINLGQSGSKTFIFEITNKTKCGAMNVLTFKIDNPVSPRSMEVNDDSRLLGFGFVSMKLK